MLTVHFWSMYVTRPVRVDPNWSYMQLLQLRLGQTAAAACVLLLCRLWTHALSSLLVCLMYAMMLCVHHVCWLAPPLSVCKQSPLFTSQSLAVLSKLPVATLSPHGLLKAIAYT